MFLLKVTCFSFFLPFLNRKRFRFWNLKVYVKLQCQVVQFCLVHLGLHSFETIPQQLCQEAQYKIIFYCWKCIALPSTGIKSLIENSTNPTPKSMDWIELNLCQVSCLKSDYCWICFVRDWQILFTHWTSGNLSNIFVMVTLRQSKQISICQRVLTAASSS